MSQAMDWYVNREISKTQSQCEMAMQRIRHARNLRELVQANHVHTQPYLRSVVQSDLNRVKRLMEEQATKLIDAQLKNVAELPPADRKKALGVLQTTEWNFLRGNLPQHFRRVETESAKLLQTPQPTPEPKV